MTLSNGAIQTLSYKLASKVVDNLSDEVAELVHMEVSQVIEKELGTVDEDLEAELSMATVMNVVFSSTADFISSTHKSF